MGIITLIRNLWHQKPQDETYRNLSIDEYSKVIEDPNVVRLDVRTAEEYADGHIANAMNIDVEKEDFESKALALLPKDRTVAINCRSGRKSIKAADILTRNGYDIFILKPGYNGWIAMGKEIAKD